MIIIDESKNELKYKSSDPIIYLADLYFTESRILKGAKKSDEYILYDQVYCNTTDGQTNKFMLSRYISYLIEKYSLGKKRIEDSKFKLEKVVLKKKISYSQISYR